MVSADRCIKLSFFLIIGDFMNARTSISLPNSSFYPMFTWFSTITQVTNFYNPFFSLHVHVSSGRFNSLREYIEFPSHVRKN